MTDSKCYVYLFFIELNMFLISVFFNFRYETYGKLKSKKSRKWYKWIYLFIKYVFVYFSLYKDFLFGLKTKIS